PTPGAVALSAGGALAVLAAFDASGAMVKAIDAAPRSAASAERLQDRLSSSSLIRQPNTEPKTQAYVFPLIAKDLRIRPAEGGPLLGSYNLNITPSSVTLISGASGAGKTTLLEALSRLQPIETGQLSYGGRKAQDWRTASLLQAVILVPQIPSFVDGTLRNQFELAKPDVSNHEIIDAVKTACANEFIDVASGDLETAFQAFQTSYSGGELRRLSLARALIIQPQILLLDEPFAGLDLRTARKLARRLEDWAHKDDRALVIIQHEDIGYSWSQLEYSEKMI
ncbi:MAG: ATP-binding cassette domain-containing protein, partial [Pseudomonadota bacterium]